MQESAPSRHATDLPSSGRRAVLWAIALVAVVHSTLVMVWVMPTNPIRDAIGTRLVERYVNNKIVPFEQNWSVFAPTPRRGGENVVVRAFIGDPKTGKGRLTNWFDVTSDEDARIKYLVNPSRIHSATRRMGGNINAAMPKFSVQQQLLTRKDYVETSPAMLYQRLAKLNQTGAVGRDNLVGYARNDDMLTRFLTMYATARWGKGITMIQFKIGHRSVPNYSRRHDENFLDVPFSYYTFGFRRAIPAPNHDAQAAFDRYVRKAPKGDYLVLTQDSKGKLEVEKPGGSR